MLATGWMVAYGYIMEAFMAWYSGDVFEQVHDVEPRVRARTAGFSGSLMFSMCVVPQALWSRRVRTHMVWLCSRGALRQCRHVAGALRDRDQLA